MSARGACQILEGCIARAHMQRCSPLLMLAWAAERDADIASNELALRLLMEAAGEPLTKWWGQGRTTAELLDLFNTALTDAQIKVLEGL